MRHDGDQQHKLATLLLGATFIVIISLAIGFAPLLSYWGIEWFMHERHLKRRLTERRVRTTPSPSWSK